MFMMLIRKDFHLQLPVLIASGLLFIAPTIIYLIIDAAISTPTTEQEPLILALSAMTMIGVLIASLTIPAFVGVAAARERRERSAEFLEAMPVRRLTIVTSRAVVALVCSLMPAIVGTFAMATLMWVESGISKGSESGTLFPNDAGQLFLVGFATVLAAAGVAWFVGSLIRSEVLAAALGIGVPIAVAMATSIAMSRMSDEVIYRLGIYRDGPEAYAFAQLAIAIPCLIAGTIIALRRTSP